MAPMMPPFPALGEVRSWVSARETAVLDHLVMPPLTQLVVPGVPSGRYRVGLAYGNACGRTPMSLQYIEFVVP